MSTRAERKRALLALWTRHVADAGLTDPDARIGRRIMAQHAGALRRYHGLGHLEFLFAEIEQRANLITDFARVRFAAWFHDAIYLSWRKDNEARSAELARRSLNVMGAAPEMIERVAALICATADHAQGGGDLDDNLFLDMDCAIIGAPPEVYERYAKGVRAEYFWAPGPLYRKGRAAFLTAQLQRDRVFLTDIYEAEFGEPARANMRRELGEHSAV
ncbi:MAG: metal-dependent phosphohydrolase [Pseudomonadota bacterium]